MSSSVQSASMTTVYIIKNVSNVVLGTVDTTKLASFSRLARLQLSRGGANNPFLLTGSVTIPESQVSGGEDAEKALKTLLVWINSNDVAHPKPLTAEAVGAGEYPQFVHLHRACFILHIERHLRGNAIRDDLVHYIRSAPLRFDEFALILEICNFDSTLATIVKRNTMMWKNKKGGVPEMAQIEEYARLHGFLDEMGRIEERTRGQT